MGILNITPDSFSDGGQLANDSEPKLTLVLNQVQKMLVAGADILDIGGESTRPGAAEIPPEEEIKRVVPVIQAIHQQFPQAIISIDTRKSTVAQAAIAAGASIINDVSGLTFDAEMVGIAAKTKAAVVIMHSQGTPQTMQNNPFYKNVVAQVKTFLASQAQWAINQGVLPENIIVDPGFGFGKTIEHNTQLLRGLADITDLGYPVLLGTSRKSFLALQDKTIAPKQREALTAATSAVGIQAGVKLIRIHDVEQQAPVIRLLDKTFRPI